MLMEALLVALDTLTKPNSRWALAFLTMSLHAQTVSILLTHYLSLLLLSVYSLFMFEFCEEHFAQPQWPLGIFF